jgi:hypothetical protein
LSDSDSVSLCILHTAYTYDASHTLRLQDTHWGHQVFYFTSAIPIQSNDKVTLDGTMEMIRSKQSARLYNVKFQYTIEAAADGSNNLMDMVESVYQIQ